MAKYRVRYTKWSKSYSEVYMTVEADSPKAAYDRVLAIQTGEDDPTSDEEESEVWGKEYLCDSGFDEMADPSEPYAVCEVVEGEWGIDELTSLHAAFQREA